MDPRSLGAEELIVSVLRLAASDVLGIAYGHNQPAARRPVRTAPRSDAEAFLRGSWAGYLSDLIGVRPIALRRELDRVRSGNPN